MQAGDVVYSPSPNACFMAVLYGYVLDGKMEMKRLGRRPSARVFSPCSICSRANKSERFTVHARPPTASHPFRNYWAWFTTMQITVIPLQQLQTLG